MARLHMSTEAQRTLAGGSHSSEMAVKKSRFIGYASQVQSWSEAQCYIDQVKAEHPKARHWCYGFRSGFNPVTERCSDDGEPTGTAGIPILGAIQGESLSDVVCVVVRYFGGIKLGAGGLIRAYGSAARLVLREAPVDVLIPKSSLVVTVDAVHIGALYDIAARTSSSVDGEEYDSDGRLTASLTCDNADLEDICLALSDSTRGTAIIRE